MCLILFAYKSHPKYKLVIAANRDEFYARETVAAKFWDDHPDMLSGRDLEGGGTWFGINRSGKVSLLTNYRDLSKIKPNAPTRGKLVSDYLIAEPDVSLYLDIIDNLAESYNGFNLILGSVDDLWYYSNVERKKYMLGSGVYGLSNRLLNSPWPKVVKGTEKLTAALKKDTLEPEDLFESLYDDLKADDKALPDTGVGIEKERMLSPMFIKSPDYGTRCTTILLVDYQNQVLFSERTYNTSTFDYTTCIYTFEV